MILYIVATPIGNLGDITLRALDVLRSVDLILAEDTRVTKKLLARYNIKKPIASYHSHSKLKRIEFIEERLLAGKKLALVSDAGTPGISDPGARLISRLRDKFGEKIKIVPIPGPSALIAALSVAGVDISRFVFLGFPPVKKKRETFFKKLGNFDLTVVLFESPHRIKKTLLDIQRFLGDRKVVVARELTKKFETIYRGRISEVLEEIREKGEFVVVVPMFIPLP